MTWQTIGLIVFVVVVAVDAVVLLVDLYLKLSGRRTITNRLRGHPVWSEVPVLWQIVGALGLYYHLVGSH